MLLCGILNLFSQSKNFRLNLNPGQCFTVVNEIKTEGTSNKQGKTSDIFSFATTEAEYKVNRKIKTDMELSIFRKDFTMDIENASVKSKQSPALADEHNIYNPSTIPFFDAQSSLYGCHNKSRKGFKNKNEQLIKRCC